MAKILIAEDDENLATFVKDWLESERHLVERAADGRTAYELLRLTSYDLIILDWNLPEMTGPEICKSLRSAMGVTIRMKSYEVLKMLTLAIRTSLSSSSFPIVRIKLAAFAQGQHDPTFVSP